MPVSRSHVNRLPTIWRTAVSKWSPSVTVPRSHPSGCCSGRLARPGTETDETVRPKRRCRSGHVLAATKSSPSRSCGPCRERTGRRDRLGHAGTHQGPSTIAASRCKAQSQLQRACALLTELRSSCDLGSPWSAPYRRAEECPLLAFCLCRPYP